MLAYSIECFVALNIKFDIRCHFERHCLLRIRHAFRASVRKTFRKAFQESCHVSRERRRHWRQRAAPALKWAVAILAALVEQYDMR